jgi:hypothetical protein
MSEPITAALSRLETFCGSKESLHLVRTPATLAETVAAPPSFRAFVQSHGYFHVTHGESPDSGHICIGLFAPEPLGNAALDNAWGDEADQALAFQRADDDAVDNFHCFNPLVDLGDGEWPVVTAYHDEELALPTEPTGNDRTFEAHLVAVIDKFIEIYGDER